MALVLDHHLFLFNDPATTEIYTLSLHDALPISRPAIDGPTMRVALIAAEPSATALTTCSRSTRSRSEEHTSELQSRQYLVCRLLLEKKKNIQLAQHVDERAPLAHPGEIEQHHCA